MRNNDSQKIAGVLAIIFGIALIASQETNTVLDAYSKAQREAKKEPNPPTVENKPDPNILRPTLTDVQIRCKEEKVEQLGLIRRTKKNIIKAANRLSLIHI